MTAQRSIVIGGGAFAGLALALALRQGLGPDVPVVVADPALALRPSRDPGASAIVAACRKLFEAIGVWDAVAPNAQPILDMVITSDYGGYMLFFFASGKCAKIPLSSYATKQNRRKLLKAYCDKEPLATMFFLPEETELAIRTSAGRMLLVGTAQIAAKTTRDSQGVAVVTLKKNQTIASVVPADTLELANPHRYRVRSLPATGALVRAEDEGEQMTLL